MAAAALAFGLRLSAAPTRTPKRLQLPAVAKAAPTVPGPAPRRRAFDAPTVNAQCEACHVDIASEWRGSLHQQAHTDPVYVEQFAKEPLPFCTACHAPEADPTRAVPARESQLGVGCVTCHVVGDQILAAKTPRTSAGSAPHAVRRAGEIEAATACAGCHEFAFPESVGHKDPLLMQSTVSEHARSPFAADSCASCHMPEVAGGAGKHRSHRFSASRDADLVRSAIRIEEKLEGTTLVLTLSADRVGHAFPTGDLLRRLRLELDVHDGRGAIVEHFERIFTKRIGVKAKPHQVPRKILAGDDRIHAATGPVVVRFEPRLRDVAASVHYTLRYERIGDPNGGVGGLAFVEGSVLLADRRVELAGVATGVTKPPTPRVAP